MFNFLKTKIKVVYRKKQRRPSTHLKKKEIARIRHLKREGYTIEEISKDLERSKSGIWKYYKTTRISTLREKLATARINHNKSKPQADRHDELCPACNSFLPQTQQQWDLWLEQVQILRIKNLKPNMGIKKERKDYPISDYFTHVEKLQSDYNGTICGWNGCGELMHSKAEAIKHIGTHISTAYPHWFVMKGDK